MTDSASTVVAVRHGETNWNDERRFQGWAPVGLNERGRRQARAVGRHLAATYEFDRVLASDLRRTRESTALIRETGVDPEPTFQKAWRERDLGIYQGLTYAQLYERYPEFDPSNGFLGVESRPEGGESLLDVHRRVRDGWDGLTADLNGETALLVTHGGVLHLLHGIVRGQDLLTAYRDHSHDNCAISEFRIDDGVEVVCTNEADWAPLASE